MHLNTVRNPHYEQVCKYITRCAKEKVNNRQQFSLVVEATNNLMKFLITLHYQWHLKTELVFCWKKVRTGHTATRSSRKKQQLSGYFISVVLKNVHLLN